MITEYDIIINEKKVRMFENLSHSYKIYDTRVRGSQDVPSLFFVIVIAYSVFKSRCRVLDMHTS